MCGYTSDSPAFLVPVVKPTKDPRGFQGFRMYAKSVQLYELVRGVQAEVAVAVEVDEDEDSDVRFQEWCDELRTATYDPSERDADDESEHHDYYRDEYEVEYEVEEDDQDEVPGVPMVQKVATVSCEAWLTPMDQECPMCLEGLTYAVCVTTSCRHAFCKTCYEQYRKMSCPCCRQWVESLTSYDMVGTVPHHPVPEVTVVN